VLAEAVELQHQLQIHLAMILGLLQRLHQPAVDGEHLLPTNHHFKKDN
jgi:hypothetical protein